MLRMDLHNEQGAYLGNSEAETLEELHQILVDEWSDPENLIIDVNDERYVFTDDELILRDDVDYNL